MEGTRGVNAINITSSGEVNGLLGCFLVEDGSLRVSSVSQPACLTLFKPHTRMDRLVLKLPDRARQVFVLFAIEGYGHAEIGVLLGISEGTSKTQYHRARQLLKEMLK